MQPLKAIKIGALVINPFFAFLLSLRDLKSRSSFLVLAVFFILFGLAFTPVNEAADSYRYAWDFSYFAMNPERNLDHAISVFFSSDYDSQSEFKDIYIYVMYYVSSIIGGRNVHILFMLFAIVFTFFCLNSFKYITRDKQYVYCLPVYILTFLFLYSNNIFNINGVRFWTASWIGVFIWFKVLVDKKYLYALGLLILPLVHISYSLFIIFSVIAFILKGRTHLLSIAFVVSFFFSEIGLMVLDSYQSYLPQTAQNMMWSYTVSDVAQRRMSGADMMYEPLYAKIFTALPRIYEMLLIFFLILKSKAIENKKIFGFTLGYFSAANICSLIPSMARFFIVGCPLVVYLWVTNLQQLKRYWWFLYLMPIAYCYSVWRWVRNVYSVTEWSLYFSNIFDIVGTYLTMN